MITSPPYGPSTHSHVTTNYTGVHKRNHLYGDLLDRGNLAKSAAATGVYSARNALGHSPGTCTAPRSRRRPPIWSSMALWNGSALSHDRP